MSHQQNKNIKISRWKSELETVLEELETVPEETSESAGW